MARKAFYSFHYAGDSHRAARIRTMGVIEGDRPCADNDWEQIKQGGDIAIQKWIDAQMVGKSVVIVLVGSETYGRKWVDYEIKKAWNSGKGLLGIHVHNMKDLHGNTTGKGKNPFSRLSLGEQKLSDIVPVYDPPFSESKLVYGHIKENLAAWIEEAIRVRNSYGK